VESTGGSSQHVAIADVNNDGTPDLFVSNLGPGRPGRLSAISFFLCKSGLYGAFVWARRALNSRKRRFPARAVDHNQLFVSSDPTASYRSCRLCGVNTGVAVSGTGRCAAGAGSEAYFCASFLARTKEERTAASG
jgi:hypothetical protein